MRTALIELPFTWRIHKKIGCGYSATLMSTHSGHMIDSRDLYLPHLP